MNTRILVVCLVTSSAVLAQTPAEPVPPAAPAYAHPLRLDASDDGDLRFLEPILKDARIVQLGENGHGSGEATAARARLVRFLHARLGFTVLAFESSLFLCHRGDAQAADADARRTLTSSVIGVWHTEQMLPLFQYMRDSRAGARPLRLAGIDVQPIGTNRKQRPGSFRDLVAPIDAVYAGEVHALDTGFLAEYDKGSSARRAYLRAQAEPLSAAYDRLASFIDRHLPALQQRAGREAPLVARQEARSMAAYVRYQSAAQMKDYAEIRDRAMADNVRFLADELFPREKIVVWGHNYHVRHDNAAIPPRAEVFPGVAARSMGSWLRERYGQALYTIGQYEFAGRTVDNARQAYDIPDAPAGSLEARLLVRGQPLTFVDLRTAAGTPAGAWLAQPIAARYNGQHDETLVPSRQYDGLLLLARVTPASYLY
jgi:erythromycin esterase